MSGVRDAINAPSRSTDRLKDATLLYLGGASLRSRISNTNVVLAWLIHLRSSSERGAKGPRRFPARVVRRLSRLTVVCGYGASYFPG